MRIHKRAFPKLNLVAVLLFVIPAVLGVESQPPAVESNPVGEGTADKVITHVPHLIQPVEIVRTTVKGEDVKLNVKIDGAGDDWLNNLSITVKNVSDKPIIFIRMYLYFPETKATGNVMFFPIRYGQNPQTPMLAGQREVLPPDQETTFVLSGQTFHRLRTFIEKRHPLNTLNKLSVQIDQVSFEDGTMWTGGDYFRPDPGNPKKYIRVGN